MSDDLDVFDDDPADYSDDALDRMLRRLKLDDPALYRSLMAFIRNIVVTIHIDAD